MHLRLPAALAAEVSTQRGLQRRARVATHSSAHANKAPPDRNCLGLGDIEYSKRLWPRRSCLNLLVQITNSPECCQDRIRVGQFRAMRHGICGIHGIPGNGESATCRA
jgi:hypothetical protein